jgi:hypothetical protein
MRSLGARDVGRLREDLHPREREHGRPARLVDLERVVDVRAGDSELAQMREIGRDALCTPVVVRLDLNCDLQALVRRHAHDHRQQLVFS